MRGSASFNRVRSTIKHLDLNASEELYNCKASTVVRPTARPSIWSRGASRGQRTSGAWLHLPRGVSLGADAGVGGGRALPEARDEFSKNSPDQAPVYWCRGPDGKPYVSPTVARELASLDIRAKEETLYQPIFGTVKQMLALEPKARPTALHLCEQF
jgi:hypothetical protein